MSKGHNKTVNFMRKSHKACVDGADPRYAEVWEYWTGRERGVVIRNPEMKTIIRKGGKP